MTVQSSREAEGGAASRVPVWLQNLAVIALLLGGCFAFVGLAQLFKHFGWTVAMWIAAVLAVFWCVFTMLALLAFGLYCMDQEVRRGLRR